MKKPSEKIGRYEIFLDEIYFIAYTGGKRELPKKDQIIYNKTLELPYQLQQKERAKIPLDKNPNVFPIKGSALVSAIKELGFIPFFNVNFSDRPVLQLTDLIVFESMRQKSYDVALK